jgi:hypothetical protein
VNLPISSVGTPAKIGAGNWITAVGAAGCPGGTTEATLKNNFVAGTNTTVSIGGRSSDAPLNGDAAMSLASELSVSPTLAAGKSLREFTAEYIQATSRVGREVASEHAVRGRGRRVAHGSMGSASAARVQAVRG